MSAITRPGNYAAHYSPAPAAVDCFQVVNVATGERGYSCRAKASAQVNAQFCRTEFGVAFSVVEIASGRVICTYLPH